MPKSVWVPVKPWPPGSPALKEHARKAEKPPELPPEKPPEPKFQGMHPARVDLLKTIVRKGSIVASQYVKSSGKGVGSVNLMLRDLEEKGILYRELDPDHVPGNGVAPYIYSMARGNELLEAELQEAIDNDAGT